MKALRGPWVLMGDWNMVPAALDAVGWVEEIEGKIVCPQVATCMGSTLDYFVIDRRLMHAVMYVRRLDNFGIHPHSPVRMAIRAEPRKLMIRTLVAPKKIPAHLPAGCLTEAQAEQKEWGAGGVRWGSG